MKRVISTSLFFLFFLFLIDLKLLSAIDWDLYKTRIDIKKNNKKWTACETNISRLPQEIREYCLGGIKRSPIDLIDGTEFKSSGKFPEKFDWRNVNGRNFTTPIKDQKNCKADWAFATFAAVETQIKIFLEQDLIMPDLSEQYVVSTTFTKGDCSGCGFYELAEWMKTNGVVWESCFPYEARNAN